MSSIANVLLRTLSYHIFTKNALIFAFWNIITYICPQIVITFIYQL